ncbi:MAG: EF-P lysine aminoacylase EpmA [Patescibacteria group bacterium]
MKTWEKLRQNPRLWERYFVRERLIRAVRNFFTEKGFHEIETPLLIARPPAESYLDVFETTLYDRQRRRQKAYLSTSPEVALKKLMVAGVGNCFSLTKSFRNMETQSQLHNPEFTILEWYRVDADYQDLMIDCEQLLLSINRLIGNKNFLIYQGEKIDLSPPWERLTVAHAFKRYSHIDLTHALTLPVMRKLAEVKGYKVEKETTWEELFHQIFLNEVEPRLGRGKPTVLYEFPASFAALAKKKESDPRWVERFEFYIAGLELGDAYSELTDWREQEERFKKEIKEIKRLRKTIYDYDHDFIRALKTGLPKCAGIAVGVDRLVMLFTDTTDIAETMFFPAKDLFKER